MGAASGQGGGRVAGVLKHWALKANCVRVGSGASVLLSEVWCQVRRTAASPRNGRDRPSHGRQSIWWTRSEAWLLPRWARWVCLPSTIRGRYGRAILP